MSGAGAQSVSVLDNWSAPVRQSAAGQSRVTQGSQGSQGSLDQPVSRGTTRELTPVREGVGGTVEARDPRAEEMGEKDG